MGTGPDSSSKLKLLFIFVSRLFLRPGSVVLSFHVSTLHRRTRLSRKSRVAATLPSGLKANPLIPSFAVSFALSVPVSVSQIVMLRLVTLIATRRLSELKVISAFLPQNRDGPL